MDVNQINAYLERAREIIGDRSQAEIDYDDAVVAHLSSGMDIKSAIAAANDHPAKRLRRLRGGVRPDSTVISGIIGRMFKGLDGVIDHPERDASADWGISAG